VELREAGAAGEAGGGTPRSPAKPDDASAARSGEAGCRAGRRLARSNVVVFAKGPLTLMVDAARNFSASARESCHSLVAPPPCLSLVAESCWSAPDFGRCFFRSWPLAGTRGLNRGPVYRRLRPYGPGVEIRVAWRGRRARLDRCGRAGIKTHIRRRPQRRLGGGLLRRAEVVADVRDGPEARMKCPPSRPSLIARNAAARFAAARPASEHLEPQIRFEHARNLSLGSTTGDRTRTVGVERFRCGLIRPSLDCVERRDG
jgi:hypothetical protein